MEVENLQTLQAGILIRLWLRRRPLRAKTYVAYSIAFSIAHRALNLLGVEVTNVINAKLRFHKDGTFSVIPLKVDEAFKIREVKGLREVQLKGSEAYIAFTGLHGTEQLSGLVVIKLGQSKAERAEHGDIDVYLNAGNRTLSNIILELPRLKMLDKKLVNWGVYNNNALIEGRKV